MCGISGIVHFKNNGHHLAKDLLSMTQTLRHRGPDDEGYVLFGKDHEQTAGGIDTPPYIFHSSFAYKPESRIESLTDNYHLGLGHRRLSIIDPTAAGHQPMCFDDKRFWIVFNGEIYNYKELREELISKGINLFTQTDTEVILAAYLHWGKGCVQKFNGMWAFVIYDKKENILFGARDRFGVKPFYYHQSNSRFCFASQQKAFLELSDFRRGTNENAVFEYIVLGKTESKPQGLFLDIIELMPSHCFVLHLSSGNFHLEKYYHLSYNNSWETYDNDKFEKYSTQVKEMMFDSVKLRLRSDVPIGSCLSGGIDSSSLVSITNHLMKNDFYSQVGLSQKVFTASYRNEKIDESEWAKKVVDTTNTTWHQVYPDAQQFLQEIEDLAYAQDIPILASSTFAQYCVMKKVKEEKIKVTLDGQGADELFSGYPAHHISYFYEALSHLAFREVRGNLKNFHPSFSSSGNLISYPAKAMLARMLFPIFKSYGFKKTRREFGYIQDHFWQTQKDGMDVLKVNMMPPLNQMLYNQFTGSDLKVLLRTGDRNAMRFSIESRVPFVDDHNMVEYIFNIPSVYKIRHSQSKSLLRHAMKGILTEEVRLRKDKLGFATPEYRWMNEAKEQLRQYITQDLNEYICTRSLLKDWDMLFQTTPRHATQRLFRIIKFAIWKKVFRT